jgi:hypothetical protein
LGKKYVGSTSRIMIPLKMKLPVTTNGVHYQSVLNAYLRSLGREIIEDVSYLLKVDIRRLSIDPITSKKVATSLATFIDGITIQMELLLHPPTMLDKMDDSNNVGTTKEMTMLSNKVLNALKDANSALRSQSRVLSKVDGISCCSRTLLAAPSLSTRPSNGVITFKMKSTDTTISQTVTFSNSVRNSNPVVIQGISIASPSAPWIAIALDNVKFPASLEYDQSIKMIVSIDLNKMKQLSSGDISGEYYQLINIQHHLLDTSSLHSIQVHLDVIGDGPSNSGSGVNPNSGSSGGDNSFGNITNPSEFINQPGFLSGFITGLILLCILSIIILLFRKICSCCCTPSRRIQLQKADKKRGTPSNKFSKITLDDDDDDDLDGLELAVQRSSSSKNSNEFGIPIRSTRSGSGERTLEPSTSSIGSSPSNVANFKLVSGASLDPDEFEPTWQSMDLTKLWGSTLKSLPTEQEWEDLLAADLISCMASGQVEDTQKFYFYATDTFTNLYLIEASITKSSKRLACVFKTSRSSKLGGGDNAKLLDSFIEFFRNCIVGYTTRL